MIRGYVAVVDKDLPLPDVRTFTDFNWVAVKLIEDNSEFFVNIEGTDYSFKVLGNIRKVDKDFVCRGLVRICFIQPNLDVVIFCNPIELKAFVYIVQVFQHLKKHALTYIIRSICVCHKLFWKPINYDFPVYDVHDISSLKRWVVYKWCYGVEDRQLGIHRIVVASYPYLTKLTAVSHNLVEFPEALGLLPCLRYLNLSANLLRMATDWKWLTSPFIRENLRELYLDANGLSDLPEAIVKLKHLEMLSLNMNCLTELPAALGNLECLSALHIQDNKLENLPASMYRKKRFSELALGGNNFHCAISNNSPRLSLEEFGTVTVPSLLEIVAKFIIIRRLAFWKHNIPTTLRDYLEGAHCCRCDSVVFHNTVGKVVQCYILAETLVDQCDDEIVHMVIRCCSYKCYKLIEPYMI